MLVRLLAMSEREKRNFSSQMDRRHIPVVIRDATPLPLGMRICDALAALGLWPWSKQCPCAAIVPAENKKEKCPVVFLCLTVLGAVSIGIDISTHSNHWRIYAIPKYAKSPVGAILSQTIKGKTKES